MEVAEPLVVGAVGSVPFWHQIAFWAAVASLVWNLINTARTEVLQHRNRTTATRLEEYRSQVRAPIIIALTAISDQRLLVEAVAISAKEVSSRKQDLQALNQDLVRGFGKLEDALSRANASRFATGDDWLTGFETFQNNSFNLVDRAISSVRPDADFAPAVQELVRELKGLHGHVAQRAEAEIETIIRR